MGVQHGPRRVRDWWLSDARQLAETFPGSFWRPDATALAQVRAGDLVKVVFEFSAQEGDSASAERMWIVVEDRFADGRLVGRLDNDPFMFENLVAGAPIGFHLDNVIDIDSVVS